MASTARSERDSYSLLNTLCQTRGVLSALVVGEALALIISFNADSAEDFWLLLGQSSLLIQFIVSLSFALLYIVNKTKPKLADSLQALAVISTLVLVTLLTTLYINFLTLLTEQSGLWFILKSCAISLLVAVLFVQFMAIYNEHAKAHSAYASAQLDALQARIRPHFLFNTLNTLAELAHHDADAAEESALALASLSRAAMNAGKQSTLADEVTLAQRYLALEQWRFGSRLSVSWRIPELPMTIVMPCLTLQPLLENAVLHGVETSAEGASIEVEVHLSKQSATVIVSNSIAVGSQNKRSHNGIAIENIRKRLAILYQGKASLTQHKFAHSYRVKLVVPRLESYSESFSR
ncbi:histidine kinase [Pseudoalteromonas sp. YIC-827]|uniref:Histidine kinase n=1 Tax=Pseudoalteromonas qingdaonensis TaxID=3131913 RepID=A0ABU9MYD5_9GAMM